MAKAGLFRVLTAIVYDSLLLVAVFFFATAILLPFNGGKAIDSQQIFYPCYLLAVAFCFYGWFWTHGGQTLGLRAWKIRVLSVKHEPISWMQAFIRFIISIFSVCMLGLGFLWILVDKHQRSWHDMASKTGIFIEPAYKK